MTRNNRIGVIGTNTTIQGHAYQRTIVAMRAAAIVTEMACPLFVPLAEEGMSNDPVTKMMAERYLAPMKTAQVDTLVLGCTHYPLLKGDIAHVMGKDVKLIESGSVLVEKIKPKLNASGATKRQLSICTTDVTGAFERLSQQIMAPEHIPALERIVL